MDFAGNSDMNSICKTSHPQSKCQKEMLSKQVVWISGAVQLVRDAAYLRVVFHK